MSNRSTLTKEISFDAGHRVPAHVAKCAHPHGHRYRVVVEAEGPVPEDGMVVDFGVLKQWMTEEIHDPYDHTMICHAADSALINAMEANGWRWVALKLPPTAENLAYHFFHRMVERAGREQAGLLIRSVTVWETPTSSAVYSLALEGS